MKIHEYQAKELFRAYGVATPLGRPALSVGEVEQAATEIIRETGSETVVVKAQIHAGGRGKGGGVKVVKGVSAAVETAKKLLGSKLKTPQTGPDGQTVRRLLVEQGVAIGREIYLGLVVDRERRRVVLIASAEGGMDIEEIARNSPEKILKEAIDPAWGLAGYQARNVAFALGLDRETAPRAVKFMQQLWRLFEERDCSLCEINPLVITQQGDVIALDAKLNFDDNAAYRHPDHERLRDLDEEDAVEIDAKKAGLSYVSLSGNIGCLVNGAGLAMATMDILKSAGGTPANFLDVGGGATQEAVNKAFKIILTDKAVRAIFVNIFGGIVKCDVIATGILAAAQEVGIEVPLIVRLEGTNAESGRKILAGSKLSVTAVQTMAEGAERAVRAAKG